MRIPLISGETIHEIDVDDILFIESDRNKIVFETFDAVLRPLTSMRDYFAYLQPAFEQIDKSTLVQISKIAHYDSIKRIIQFEHDDIIKTRFVSRRNADKIESLLH